MSNASGASKEASLKPGNAAAVKRWDGETHTATEWAGFHRDPELWMADGNCLIYLHCKGQSSRGPSFRIPFSTLVQAKCFAFIERYIEKDGFSGRLPRNASEWSRVGSRRTIELYIPIPRAKSRLSAGRHLLAIRNFLSWATGGSMVGEHLGGALVALVHTMAKYRSQSESHIQDLMTYMNDQGYLDFILKPSHALAGLYLAEYLRLKNLYIRAFTHCTGMGEKLYSSTEYTKISLASRKLLRSTREAFRYKLEDATEALTTFLDDELSESRLGLPSETRAHLERFRSFLLAFYTKKLGYYPPREFDPATLALMLQDFEALYDLLVDDGCSMPTTRTSANGGSGGLCMLQLLKSFDVQNRLDTLRHPLPLLPEALDEPKSKSKSRSSSASRHHPSTRRKSWLGAATSKAERDGPPNSKLLAHTALIKASNWREQSFKNDLVRAYREYEGQTIVSPNRADKRERVSLVDARKVRWILIYTTYQVLRSVAKRPMQVEGESAPYHLAASADDLPPVSKHLEVSPSKPPRSSSGYTCAGEEAISPTMVEIKPDIDYFALTHRDTQQQQLQPQSQAVGRRQSTSAVPEASKRPLSRSGSVTRMLTRSATLRRSFRRFRPATPTAPSEVVTPPRHAYHEIVVHGYGNGTNDVSVEGVASARIKAGAETLKPAMAAAKPRQRDQYIRRRSLPAESRVSYRNSNASSVTTLETDKLSGPASPATESSSEFEQQQQQRDVAEPIIVRNSSHKSLTQRYPMRTVLETIGRTSSMRRSSISGKDGINAPSQGMLARGPSFRKSLIPESWSLGGGGGGGGGKLCESEIDEEGDVLTALQAEAEDDWVAMQAFLDQDGSHKVQRVPAWEQYADIGGLTEIR